MASFEHTPAVAAYLPSEVARLVLGYLKDENCMKTCEIFLTECRHLKEYSTLLKQGLTYPLHVDGKSLVTILDEYRSMAQEELDPHRPGWLKQLWRKHDIMINQLKLVHGLPYSSTHSGRQHGAGLQRPLRRSEASNFNATVEQGAALSSSNSVMDITAEGTLVETRKQGYRRQSSRQLTTMAVAKSPASSVAHSLALAAATVHVRSVPSGTVSSSNTELCDTLSADVASGSLVTKARFRDSPVARCVTPVTVRSPAAVAVQPPTAQALSPVSTTAVDACSVAPNIIASLAVSQPVYVTSSLPTAVTTSSTATTAASSFCVPAPLHSSCASQRECGGTSDIGGTDVEPHNISDRSTLRETVHLTAVRETPTCAIITSTACPAAASTDTNRFAQAAVASVPPGSVAGTVDITMGSPRRKRSSTDRKKRMTPGKNLRSPGKEDAIENLSDLFPMPCLVETLLKATDWHEHLAENINRHLTRKSTEKSNDEAQNNAEEIANTAATATDDPVIRFEESETDAAIREVLALTRDDPTFNDFHALIDNVYADLTQDPPDHASAANLYDSTICYSDVEVVHCDSGKVSRQTTSSAHDRTRGVPSPDVATAQQPPVPDHYQNHQPSQWQHNGELRERSTPSVDTRAHCAAVAASGTVPAATPSVALGTIPCTGDSAVSSTAPAACVISVPAVPTNTVLPSGLVLGEPLSPTASVNSPHAAIAMCEGPSGSTPSMTVYTGMMSATPKLAQRATGSVSGGSRCSSRVASPTQLYSSETATTGSTAGASRSTDNRSMAASSGSMVASTGSVVASGDSMAASDGSTTASGGCFVNLAPHPTESGTTMYVVISNGNKIEKQIISRGRPRVPLQPTKNPVKHIKPLRPANSAVFGSTVKSSSAVLPTASPNKLAVKTTQRGQKKSQKKKVAVQSSAASSETTRMAQRKLTILNAKTSSHRSGSHVRVLTFSPSRPDATVAARRSSSSSNSDAAAIPVRGAHGRHTAANHHKQPVLPPARSPPAAASASATAAAAAAPPEDTVPELVGQVIHVVEQQDDHRVLQGDAAGEFVIVKSGTMDLDGRTSSAISSDDDLFRQFTIVDNASEPAALSGPPRAATTVSISCSNDCVQHVATNALPAALPGQPVADGIGHAHTLKKRPVNKRAMSERLTSERKDAKKRKLKSYNINNLLSKIHQ